MVGRRDERAVVVRGQDAGLDGGAAGPAGPPPLPPDNLQEVLSVQQ